LFGSDALTLIIAVFHLRTTQSGSTDTPLFDFAPATGFHRRQFYLPIASGSTLAGISKLAEHIKTCCVHRIGDEASRPGKSAASTKGFSLPNGGVARATNTAL